METGIRYRNGEAVGCNEYESFGGTEVTYPRGTYPCDALVLVHLEDGPGAYPCGAPAEDTPEGGFRCDGGHEYTPLAVRHAEGWDYAEDHAEATRLRSLGVDVVEAF